ncbi:MAG: 50S ribosomal protein L23 [Candidatus Woesearchaeota archaeon]|nr:50S ribosomal protein L23 [Candidatus Woesearchaeota archaeon]
MSVVKYPLATEKSVRFIDEQNKIVFVVKREASKPQIKEDIEAMLKTKVKSINTLMAPDGNKRAYIEFTTPAIDIATNLGLM